MDIVKKEYIKDSYDGYPCTVEITPCGVDSTDPFPGHPYASELKKLSNCHSWAQQETFPSELKAEMGILFRHFSSSTFMSQFIRCDDPACTLTQCGPRVGVASDVDRLFEKFGGIFPTPIPQFVDPTTGSFPFDRKADHAEPDDLPNDVPAYDPPGRSHRYLTFADLLRTDLDVHLPVFEKRECQNRNAGRRVVDEHDKMDSVLRPDRFHVGQSAQRICTKCVRPVFLSSDVAVKRHDFLAHDDRLRARDRR